MDLRLTVIFFREGMFYPIDLLNPETCGKSIKEQAKEHAELNPGTIKVTTVHGDILWQSPTKD